MKKHNAIKVVLLTTAFCILMTWIFHAASYSSDFVDQGRIQMGLFDIYSYLLTSLSYFGYISLFIIVVGGFYGILNKIPAYQDFLDRTANKFKKHGLVFIGIVVVLLALITSICSLQIGLMVFFPLIASIILLMGYDKIVVALTLVGSTMIGVAGTTYGYENVNLLNSFLSSEMTYNMGLKFAILLVGVVVLMINIILISKRNNKKVEVAEEKKEEVVEVKKVEVKATEAKATTKSSSNKKSSKKSTSKKSSNGKKSSGKSSKKSSSKSNKSKNHNKAAAKGEDVIVVKDKKSSIIPLIITFIILFVIMVLAFIPWGNSFEITAFQDATNAVSEFTIFGFPLFGKLLGSFSAFGNWMINDLITVILVASLILVLMYNVKFKDAYAGFIEGAKKAIYPAVVVLFIYTILVINVYHPYQLTIYKAILGITKKFNLFTTTIVSLLAGVLNVEPTYAFNSVVPYIAGTYKESLYPQIEIISQTIYGFSMLLAPTSVILMSTLAALEISFKDWFKAVWKLLLELFIIFLIIFLILALV